MQKILQRIFVEFLYSWQNSTISSLSYVCVTSGVAKSGPTQPWLRASDLCSWISLRSITISNLVNHENQSHSKSTVLIVLNNFRWLTFQLVQTNQLVQIEISFLNFAIIQKHFDLDRTHFGCNIYTYVYIKNEFGNIIVFMYMLCRFCRLLIL